NLQTVRTVILETRRLQQRIEVVQELFTGGNRQGSGHGSTISNRGSRPSTTRRARSVFHSDSATSSGLGWSILIGSSTLIFLRSLGFVHLSVEKAVKPDRHANHEQNPCNAEEAVIGRKKIDKRFHCGLHSC